jgi:hypothetical protein
MPKAMRYSPTYQSRRSYSQRPTTTSFDDTASVATSPSPSAAAKPGGKSRSMAYLRSRVSSSLNSPQNASPVPMGIASESYLRLKKKGALTTWSTRYFVLRGAQLVWFSSKQDAQWRRGVQEIQYVESGKLTTLRSRELGLEIKMTDGKEYVARAFDRADLAKWITAFHRLALKKETKRASTATTTASSGGRFSDSLTADSTATGDLSEVDLELRRQQRAESEPLPDKAPSGRHVSFHSSVLVRMIPTVTDDQVAELFYSREDMQRFSSRATSLRSRTEDAMSCACMAIRLPGSISCFRGESVRSQGSVV